MFIKKIVEFILYEWERDFSIILCTYNDSFLLIWRYIYFFFELLFGKINVLRLFHVSFFQILSHWEVFKVL